MCRMIYVVYYQFYDDVRIIKAHRDVIDAADEVREMNLQSTEGTYYYESVRLF